MLFSFSATDDVESLNHTTFTSSDDDEAEPTTPAKPKDCAQPEDTASTVDMVPGEKDPALTSPQTPEPGQHAFTMSAQTLHRLRKRHAKPSMLIRDLYKKDYMLFNVAHWHMVEELDTFVRHVECKDVMRKCFGGGVLKRIGKITFQLYNTQDLGWNSTFRISKEWHSRIHPLTCVPHVDWCSNFKVFHLICMLWQMYSDYNIQVDQVEILNAQSLDFSVDPAHLEAVCLELVYIPSGFFRFRNFCDRLWEKFTVTHSNAHIGTQIDNPRTLFDSSRYFGKVHLDGCYIDNFFLTFQGAYQVEVLNGFIRETSCYQWVHMKNLHTLSINNVTFNEPFEIRDLENLHTLKLEKLFCSSGYAMTNLPKLRTFTVRDCNGLGSFRNVGDPCGMDEIEVSYLTIVHVGTLNPLTQTLDEKFSIAPLHSNHVAACATSMYRKSFAMHNIVKAGLLPKVVGKISLSRVADRVLGIDPRVCDPRVDGSLQGFQIQATEVTLENCPNVETFPSMPFLKRLRLVRVDRLRTIADLPQLTEEIHVESCPNLKHVFALNKVSRATFQNCNALSAMPFLKKATHVTLNCMESLCFSPSNLPRVEHLRLRMCSKLDRLAMYPSCVTMREDHDPLEFDERFESLVRLELVQCERLEFVSGTSLPNLQHMTIARCPRYDFNKQNFFHVFGHVHTIIVEFDNDPKCAVSSKPDIPRYVIGPDVMESRVVWESDDSDDEGWDDAFDIQHERCCPIYQPQKAREEPVYLRVYHQNETQKKEKEATKRKIEQGKEPGPFPKRLETLRLYNVPVKTVVKPFPHLKRLYIESKLHAVGFHEEVHGEIILDEPANKVEYFKIFFELQPCLEELWIGRRTHVKYDPSVTEPTRRVVNVLNKFGKNGLSPSSNMHVWKRSSIVEYRVGTRGLFKDAKKIAVTMFTGDHRVGAKRTRPVGGWEYCQSCYDTNHQRILDESVVDLGLDQRFSEENVGEELSEHDEEDQQEENDEEEEEDDETVEEGSEEE